MFGRLHVASAWVVTAVGSIHCMATPILYDAWEPATVWFLGAGMGLLLLGAVNLAGAGMPALRLANALFLAFGRPNARKMNYVTSGGMGAGVARREVRSNTAPSVSR